MKWIQLHPYWSTTIFVASCLCVVATLLYKSKVVDYVDKEMEEDADLTALKESLNLDVRVLRQYAGCLGNCMISYTFTPGIPTMDIREWTYAEVNIIAVRTVQGLCLSGNILEMLTPKQVSLLKDTVYKAHTVKECAEPTLN